MSSKHTFYCQYNQTLNVYPVNLIIFRADFEAVFMISKVCIFWPYIISLQVNIIELYTHLIYVIGRHPGSKMKLTLLLVISCLSICTWVVDGWFVTVNVETSFRIDCNDCEVHLGRKKRSIDLSPVRKLFCEKIQHRSKCRVQDV